MLWLVEVLLCGYEANVKKINGMFKERRCINDGNEGWGNLRCERVHTEQPTGSC